MILNFPEIKTEKYAVINLLLNINQLIQGDFLISFFQSKRKVFKMIWVKVFKNGPSRRQPLKNSKCYGLLRHGEMVCLNGMSDSKNLIMKNTNFGVSVIVRNLLLVLFSLASVLSRCKGSQFKSHQVLDRPQGSNLLRGSRLPLGRIGRKHSD